ncbi:uncharacterized protein [Argopecten irradians]|uniref:uncharacterized protein isoform X2 n=1 Tax=Argopecten irradians TaxID=31199 RepID=UPI00371D3BE5
MDRFTSFLVFLMILLHATVPRAAPPEWYGKCVKYCRPRPPPKIKGYQIECLPVGGCSYCKFFPCPEFPVCGNGEVPIPTRERVCMTCPGECLYLGETFALGESGIKSVDNVNECHCRGFWNFPQLVCHNKEPTPTPQIFCEY